MGKVIVALVVVVIAGYFGWTRYDNFATSAPVYAELRLKLGDTGVELVGIGKMNSDDDCHHRAERMWEEVLASNTQAQITSIRCTPEIAARYQGLFEDRVISATYIALTVCIITYCYHRAI